MTTLIGLCLAIRSRVRVIHTERLCFAAGFLLAFCVLLLGSGLAGAQEMRRDEGSLDMILDLSEEDTLDEELPERKRLMLEIPLPSLNEEEKRQEREEPGGGAAPPVGASESELWHLVQGLQQDLEMLKEEIAQLRSEFRSLMPKDSEGEAVAARTVNPFWITDAQLERLEQR